MSAIDQLVEDSNFVPADSSKPPSSSSSSSSTGHNRASGKESEVVFVNPSEARLMPLGSRKPLQPENTTMPYSIRAAKEGNKADPMICIGASIFVFSIEPKFGVPMILLARQRKQRWLGNSNYNYTDFGGGATNGQSAERTAAREFVEESCGAIRYFNNPCLDRLPVLEDNVAEDLVTGAYVAKIETPVTEKKGYVTFIKQVPFQPGICGAFRRAKDQLFKARDDAQGLSAEERQEADLHPGLKVNRDTGHVKIDRCYLEKQGLEYFSLPSIEYWLNTGIHNLVPAFSCQPYFKSRLRLTVRYLREQMTEVRRLRSARRSKFVPIKAKPSYTHFPHQQRKQRQLAPIQNDVGFYDEGDTRWKPGAGSRGTNAGDRGGDGGGGGNRGSKWPRRRTVQHVDQPSDRVNEDRNCRTRYRCPGSHYRPTKWSPSGRRNSNNSRGSERQWRRS